MRRAMQQTRRRACVFSPGRSSCIWQAIGSGPALQRPAAASTGDASEGITLEYTNRVGRRPTARLGRQRRIHGADRDVL